MKLQRLYLRTDLVEFAAFPYNSKTGENIRTWFVASLKHITIEHCDVSSITPDGAADGQCGLNLIDTLAEKVDTCNLHQLQRAVLIAMGLTGVSCKNVPAKANFKKHNRIVMLSNQNLKVPAAIDLAQMAAGVLDHETLGLVKTAVTRWGNQYSQIERNNLLRLAIDPTVDKYKRENKGEKEAIIENDLNDNSTKVGKAVPASEIGLTADDWEESQELEAFLEYPYKVKEIVEKGNGACTGAQSLQLMFDLKENFCDGDAGLSVKVFPATLSMADCTRAVEHKSADALGDAVSTGRDLMRSELQARFFELRPSNLRLVQCFMSKQPGFDCKNYLKESQYQLAETLYLQAMRAAQSIAPAMMLAPSAKKIKVEDKIAASGSPLFKGAQNVLSGDAA